ncbi:Phage tail protein [uncultured Defluviicoccus sp.]|uniref:Phage tail protein n=1 Tax=metagenome TaxID=256318 RepID=A0A380T939_9ZZZZ|nr:Phage tail protein [uncultured Defluviicoccus sp.]
MPHRSDPHRSFRFRLEIGGLDEGGFQTVSGIERETQIEPYREGGVNDYEHKLVTRTTYPPLVLKRGLVGPSLWDWHQRVINGEVQRQTISIVLLDERGDEAWRWVCADAFPSKWTGAELDATANAIATESVEFVHHGLTRQP